MKFVVKAAVAACVVGCVAFSNIAKADPLALSICEYVAANDKSKLRKQLKSSKVKLRNVYEGIVCNGNTLLRHAMVSSADEVGQFMVKKLPAKKLAGFGDVEWATSNGHDGSPIVAAIKQRIGG